MTAAPALPIMVTDKGLIEQTLIGKEGSEYMTQEQRQQARESINSRPLTDFVSLSKTKGGLYECPVCHSGTRANRTGGLSITADGKRVTCFAKGCFGEKGEDTLGALRIIWNATETEVFTMAGIDTGGPSQGTAQEIRPPKVEQKSPDPPEPKADFSAYIKQAQTDLDADQKAKDYLAGRGLTEESVVRFRLGYDREKRAIVIPYGRNYAYYITRSIDGKEYRKPPQAKAGKEPLYNVPCLYTQGGGAVFVVESVFCAMSLMQAGADAVALNGTGGEKLLKQITTQPTGKTLILSLDNDQPGQEAQERLIDGLKELGASFVPFNVAGEHKDPNDALQADKEAFGRSVGAGIAAAEAEAQKVKAAEDQKRAELAYQFKAKYSAAGRIHAFVDGIAESVHNPPQPTGFALLDSILDGGIYSGYLILTGGTSVGKTAITLQIADNIARAGRDVLYFTLEMTAADLMARTISRLTYQNCGGYVANAKTARHITDGTKRALYSQAEERLVAESTLEYADTIAPHMCFIEPQQFGKDFLSTNDIKAVLEEYKQGLEPGQQGPFVIVDYAQLLRPAGQDGKGMDAKQNMSDNATVLYHISKQYNIPLLAITSQPRSEYGKNDSMNAGKESGDLEYSAEYLFRLQFQKPSDKDKENPGGYEKKEKRKDPRQVELAIMKNRSGQTGDTILFDYFAKFNYFEEKRRVID